MKTLFLLALLLSFSNSLWAQELKDEVSLTSASGSQGGRSGYIRYVHFTESQYQFEVLAGSSRNIDNRDEVTSRTFSIGMSTDPLNDWQLGGYLENWGLVDELQEKKLRVPFRYSLGENWEFRTAAHLGNLVFQNISTETEDVKVSSTAIELGVAFYGLKNWRFSFDIEGHEYGTDLTQYNNERVASIFSDSTLALTSALIKSQSRLSVVHSWEKWDLGVTLGGSKSAIDESVMSFFEVNGFWDISEAWFANATFGNARVTDYGLIPLAFRDDEVFGYGEIGGGFRW